MYSRWIFVTTEWTLSENTKKTIQDVHMIFTVLPFFDKNKWFSGWGLGDVVLSMLDLKRSQFYVDMLV